MSAAETLSDDEEALDEYEWDALNESLAIEAATMAAARSLLWLDDTAMARLAGWIAWGSDARWIGEAYGLDDANLESAIAGVRDATAARLVTIRDNHFSLSYPPPPRERIALVLERDPPRRPWDRP